MIKFIVYIGILLTAIFSCFMPSVSVIVYYFISVLQPQAIWFWAFNGLRPALICATIVFIVFIIDSLNRKDFSFIYVPQVILLLLLVFWALLSLFFGALGGGFSSSGGYQLQLLAKMCFMAIMTIAIIKDVKEVKLLSYIIILSSCYLIYWGNMQYITGAMYCNPLCRLNGPGGAAGSGSYHEENVFATFFVVTMPYIYYYIFYSKKTLLKLVALIFIPLGWNALFLTGSRGGFLGLFSSVFLMLIFLKKKIISVLLIVALVVFFVWQGGSLMKKRVDTIDSYHTNKSAMERIVCWQLGWRMLKDYPIFGVGLSNFTKARSLYGDNGLLGPMSTFNWSASELGIPGFIIFVLIEVFTFKDFLKTRYMIMTSKKVVEMLPIVEASLCALIGYIVCSIFLCIQFFELFYLLVAVSAICKRIAIKYVYT